MPVLTKRLCVALAALCLSTLPALACPTGKPVEIEWNGGQFPGMVLDGPDAQGNCLVSYDGYDETWNEWVSVERLANLDVAGTAPPPPPPPPSACPIGASRQIEWNGSQWDGTILDGPNAAGECFVTYDGWDESWNEWVVQGRIAPDPNAAPAPVAGAGCPVGQSLEIEWNGSLWDGAVLDGPNAQGQCFVTYDGWDASWNEWVTTDRLRDAE